jgi:hypothetical protein
MLSDLTISYADRSLTLPGIYLLIGILIVLGLAGFVVALTSTRRIERKPATRRRSWWCSWSGLEMRSTES